MSKDIDGVLRKAFGDFVRKETELLKAEFDPLERSAFHAWMNDFCSKLTFREWKKDSFPPKLAETSSSSSLSESDHDIQRGENRKRKSKKPSNNNNNNNDKLVVVVTELPSAFQEKIQEMEGSEVKLVIQKELCKSDVIKNNGRFSIPLSQIQKETDGTTMINWLTELENSLLDQKNEDGTRKHLCVVVLDPGLNCWDLHLKKWNMRTTYTYNITTKWYDLVQQNSLKEHDVVQLWSFRRHNNQLYFALVKLERSNSASSSK